MRDKTALVLSAGGMFGAYQAGAWKVLARWLQPDLVIGASVGALNAWAIAGGTDPEELAARWLDPESSSLAVLRLRPPWRGVFDPGPLHARIQALWAACQPRTEVAVLAIGLPRLRPRLFVGPEITWRHLAASCAVLCCYPQVRLDGELYTDGGLLGALPVWAAAHLGATRVVAINALPKAPSRIVRLAVTGLRALAPRLPAVPGSLEVAVLSPEQPLGPLRDTLFWRREAAERWIALGQCDAERFTSRNRLQ